MPMFLEVFNLINNFIYFDFFLVLFSDSYRRLSDLMVNGLINDDS